MQPNSSNKKSNRRQRKHHAAGVTLLWSKSVSADAGTGMRDRRLRGCLRFISCSFVHVGTDRCPIKTEHYDGVTQTVNTNSTQHASPQSQEPPRRPQNAEGQNSA